jgi:hypothetical protein
VSEQREESELGEGEGGGGGERERLEKLQYRENRNGEVKKPPVKKLYTHLLHFSQFFRSESLSFLRASRERRGWVWGWGTHQQRGEKITHTQNTMKWLSRVRFLRPDPQNALSFMETSHRVQCKTSSQPTTKQTTTTATTTKQTLSNTARKPPSDDKLFPQL